MNSFAVRVGQFSCRALLWTLTCKLMRPAGRTTIKKRRPLGAALRTEEWVEFELLEAT